MRVRHHRTQVNVLYYNIRLMKISNQEKGMIFYSPLTAMIVTPLAIIYVSLSFGYYITISILP